MSAQLSSDFEDTGRDVKCDETNETNMETTITSKTDVDFESETFDARTALLSDESHIVLPTPDAQTYNNMDEYFAKTFHKANALKLLSKVDDEIKVIERDSRLAETLTSPKRRKERTTVLTKMNQTSGPYFLLYRAINNRIKVLIRRRKRSATLEERFGWVCGLLIAFDKHYNLALTDADETYQRINKFNVKVEVNNHIKQLFIRGDNVVLVSFH